MMLDALADHGLNYAPCRYGTSRLLFRGPRRRLEGDYVAAVGGTETYGKYVERPYPVLLEEALGVQVVNLGAVNAGIDVFASDDSVQMVCAGARAVALQVMGAHNLRNRFYSVHPRRNDRFLRATPALRALYPEIDFTDFAFTRHLIRTLLETDAGRFATVRDELQSAWLLRMQRFLGSVDAPVVLVWMADRRPEEVSVLDRANDPLFVTAGMIEALRPQLAGVVDATPSPAARRDVNAGIVCSEFEVQAAAEVPNARIHAEIAQAVALGLRGLA